MTAVVAPPPVMARSARRLPLVALLAAAVVIVVAWMWWQQGADQRAVLSGTEPVSAAELSARRGIEVTLIAESGGGGMVDFRFRVTDASMAEHVFHDMPVLVADDGSLITMSSMHHTPALQNGRQYFMLYGNSNGAVRSGETVTVVIGDVRLEDVPVA